jgi:hypothetical protein
VAARVSEGSVMRSAWSYHSIFTCLPPHCHENFTHCARRFAYAPGNLRCRPPMPHVLFTANFLENGVYTCHARVGFAIFLTRNAFPERNGWGIMIHRGPSRGYDGKYPAFHRAPTTLAAGIDRPQKRPGRQRLRERSRRDTKRTPHVAAAGDALEGYQSPAAPVRRIRSAALRHPARQGGPVRRSFSDLPWRPLRQRLRGESRSGFATAEPGGGSCAPSTHRTCVPASGQW